MKCKKCNSLFVNPLPSVKTQQEYYDKMFKEGNYKVYSDQENLRILLNEKRFAEIQYYQPKGNLLDIGCATGYFLDIAARNGMKVYGVELSKEAARKASSKHKNIFNGTLEDANYKDSFFDLVTFFDIIEHVLDPTSTIKEIRRIIKPDGLIVLTTPDITSWHAKIMGKSWGFVLPFEHLFYFSPSSMKLLLEKNGFGILELRKNYKIFTIVDILKMAEYYYPKKLVKILSVITSILPKKILLKQRNFYFGEMFVVAKKLC